MINRRFLLTAAALLLTGCTTLTGPVGTRRFSGRFSLRAANAEGVQTAAGKYRLTATGDVYELVILSPLNGVLGKVTVTPTEARVERGGHPDLTAPTETQLVQNAFGFDLPIAVFTTWLEGQPSPKAPFERTAAGSFAQSGWNVTYTASPAAGRPAVLKLSRADALQRLNLTMTVEKETVSAA